MNIELETLNLIRYNEEKHKVLKEEFKNGESASKFIYSIEERLEGSKNNDRTIFQSAFVVEDKEKPIGYIYISNMKFDEVFFECSILKKFRGQGYGKKILNEITDYLFQEHNIKSIRLDIDPSNKNSISSATSCGYFLDEEEYESRNYTGKMQFVKESEYYISKRRK